MKLSKFKDIQIFRSQKKEAYLVKVVKEKNTNKEETSKNSLLIRVVIHPKMTDKQKITEFITTLPDTMEEALQTEVKGKKLAIIWKLLA